MAKTTAEKAAKAVAEDALRVQKEANEQKKFIIQEANLFAREQALRAQEAKRSQAELARSKQERAEADYKVALDLAKKEAEREAQCKVDEEKKE